MDRATRDREVLALTLALKSWRRSRILCQGLTLVQCCEMVENHHDVILGMEVGHDIHHSRP